MTLASETGRAIPGETKTKSSDKMKTYIAQTSSTETADTYSVWSKSARGIEWKKGPVKKIELAASGRGTPAFWNSPAGKFIASGLQLIAA